MHKAVIVDPAYDAENQRTHGGGEGGGSARDAPGRIVGESFWYMRCMAPRVLGAEWLLRAYRMWLLGLLFTHSRIVSATAQPNSRAQRHNLPCCNLYKRLVTMSENNLQPPDTHMEMNDELDHTVDDEIKQDATQLETDAMNLDGTNEAEPAAVNGVVDSAAAFEARIPAKKDATLREFLGKMDEYAPIVCDYPPLD